MMNKQPTEETAFQGGNLGQTNPTTNLNNQSIHEKLKLFQETMAYLQKADHIDVPKEYWTEEEFLQDFILGRKVKEKEMSPTEGEMQAFDEKPRLSNFNYEEYEKYHTLKSENPEISAFSFNKEKKE